MEQLAGAEIIAVKAVAHGADPHVATPVLHQSIRVGNALPSRHTGGDVDAFARLLIHVGHARIGRTKPHRALGILQDAHHSGRHAFYQFRFEMDAAGAVGRKMIDSTVVGGHPKVTMPVAHDSRHTIGAERVALHGTPSHIFEIGHHVGHDQHFFPVNAHPNVALHIHDGILHVGNGQVVFVCADVALPHFPGGFVINHQPVAVGGHQQAAIGHGIGRSHHQIVAGFHLAERPEVLRIAVKPAGLCRKVNHSRHALAKLQRPGIVSHLAHLAPVDDPHVALRRHHPRASPCVAHHPRRLPCHRKVAHLVECHPAVFLLHAIEAISGRGGIDHAVWQEHHGDDMRLRRISLQVYQGNVGETVGGIFIRLHPQLRAHQHRPRTQFEHTSHIIVVQRAGDPILVVINVHLCPVVTVQPVLGANPHVLVTILRERTDAGVRQPIVRSERNRELRLSFRAQEATQQPTQASLFHRFKIFYFIFGSANKCVSFPLPSKLFRTQFISWQESNFFAKIKEKN